jgi:metal-responsive CopG/Arc/MetJ family transcriptional regulator
MKVNVSLDDELMVRIDNYADNNYMSRSGFISLACTQYLNSMEAMMLVKDMALAMRKIADSGTVDDATIKQLEDFERISKFLVGQR